MPRASRYSTTAITYELDFTNTTKLIKDLSLVSVDFEHRRAHFAYSAFFLMIVNRGAATTGRKTNEATCAVDQTARGFMSDEMFQ